VSAQETLLFKQRTHQDVAPRPLFISEKGLLKNMGSIRKLAILLRIEPGDTFNRSHIIDIERLIFRTGQRNWAMGPQQDGHLVDNRPNIGYSGR
jgi:hypothetical protein